MVLYECDIQKYDGDSYYWTNQYHIEAGDYTSALTTAVQITDIERTIHTTRVQYNALRVKLKGTPHGASQIQPLSGYGTYAATGSDKLSYWNVVRCDFAVALGMPNRKYLRTLMDEAMIFGLSLSNGYHDFIQTNYVLALLQVPGLRSNHDQLFVDGVCKPNVAMRQMRRGSKRKARPVI
jgi:hypothetical protein